MTRSSTDIKSRAEVYCRVAFDAVSTASDIDGAVALRNDLFDIFATLARNVDFRAVLTSSDFEEREKVKLVDTLTSGKSEVGKSLMISMFQNDDIEALRLIARLVEERIQQEYSVCIVDVVTAVELDDQLRDLIKDKVKKDLGLDAILHESLDNSIVGGIIMSVNGKCIDASMRAQLNHARSVLKAS